MGRELVQLNMCGEPREVSLLALLWYMKSAGGTDRINSTDNGAQVPLAIVNPMSLILGAFPASTCHWELYLWLVTM